MATQNPQQTLGSEQAVLGGTANFPHQNKVSMVEAFPPLWLTKEVSRKGLQLGSCGWGILHLEKRRCSDAQLIQSSHIPNPHGEIPMGLLQQEGDVQDCRGDQIHPLRHGGSYIMKSCDLALSLIVPHKPLLCCLNTLLSKPDGSGTEMTSQRHTAGKLSSGNLCN